MMWLLNLKKEKKQKNNAFLYYAIDDCAEGRVTHIPSEFSVKQPVIRLHHESQGTATLSAVPKSQVESEDGRLSEHEGSIKKPILCPYFLKKKKKNMSLEQFQAHLLRAEVR